MYLGVAHEEAAHRAGRDRNLNGHGNGIAPRYLERGEPMYGLLHGKSAGYGPQPLVPLKPAEDSIAAEGDDAAAEVVDLGNQGFVDKVKVAR